MKETTKQKVKQLALKFLLSLKFINGKLTIDFNHLLS